MSAAAWQNVIIAVFTVLGGGVFALLAVWAAYRWAHRDKGDDRVETQGREIARLQGELAASVRREREADGGSLPSVVMDLIGRVTDSIADMREALGEMKQYQRENRQLMEAMGARASQEHREMREYINATIAALSAKFDQLKANVDQIKAQVARRMH